MTDKNQQKPYILQGKDSACQLITLLNAMIHWTGETPIVYKSEKFQYMLKECGGIGGPIINIRPALEYLNLHHERYKPRRMKNLKKWIKRQLREGKLVDYRFSHPDWNGHSCLIVDYNHRTDSFKFVNAQLFNRESPVEYLPLEATLVPIASKHLDHSKYSFTVYKNLGKLYESDLSETMFWGVKSIERI